MAERERLAPYFDAPPDKTLALVAEMDMGAPEGPAVYVCPMHPDVVSDRAGRCPKCWMKLLAIAAPHAYVCPMHPDVVSEKAGAVPEVLDEAGPGCARRAERKEGRPRHPTAPHAAPRRTAAARRASAQHAARGTRPRPSTRGSATGIEWEDDMVDVNRITTPANMHWRFVDRETGAVNHAIDWRFRVGDRVKLRLVNEMDSDHPMHHPFHIHGAGRFVVLARDGVSETNLVWKDTVLVRTGETVDILLNVTNPGVWMAHCHIAEHHESGMMFSFNVAPAEGRGGAA